MLYGIVLPQWYISNPTHIHYWTVGKHFPFGYGLLDISLHLTEILKYLFCLLNTYL